MSVIIAHKDFDHTQQYNYLSEENSTDGAVVTFTGLVREFSSGDNVTALELEHYPGMTQSLLDDIITQAKKRWQLGRVRIYHRIGYLPIGEQIVFVGVTSKHRAEAFSAAEFIMDFLKNQATFWKKEHFSGSSRWVQAKQSDKAALTKWQKTSSTESQ